jgi:putative phage-type endonuclease
MNAQQIAAWREERRTGIGSSDAADLFGLGFHSRLELYLDKKGQLPEREPTAEMLWGIRHEATIAQAYQEETGKVLQVPQPVMRHPAHSWMLASIDRMADDRIVEIKTANAFQARQWGEQDTDEIPEAYVLQVQHQMEVASFELADVAVLIGGSDFRVYTVRRNREIGELLIAAGAEFWDRIQRSMPPEPEWRHPETLRLIEALYGFDETTVQLGDDVQDLADQYSAAGVQVREAEDLRNELKARILVAMGEAMRGNLPDGRQLRRRRVARRAHEVAESSYLDFRITKARAKCSQ